MADTYIVKKGDTLSGIAQTYKSQYGYTDTYDYLNRLMNLNGVSNVNYIVVGQVIRLDGDPVARPNTATSRATIAIFGLQSNTDRTLYVSWNWTKPNTQGYQVSWYYDTGDGVWFVGDDAIVTAKQSVYIAPANAVQVKFKVKPISEKRIINNSETVYWYANWSTEKMYNFTSSPPLVPPIPTVTIDKYILMAELKNIQVNTDYIQFQIVRDDLSVFQVGAAGVVEGNVTYSCTIDAGSNYKVRCRSYKGNTYSEWSGYSENVASLPSAPKGIDKCEAISETSVYLEWPVVKTAKTYDIEYATEKRYLGASNQSTIINDIESTHYEVGGLETGDEYFFRVRGSSETEKSPWSEIASIIIGKEPAAPTTWSSTTTVVTGESLSLYWVHNAEDGSSQSYAELEIYIDGIKESHTIKNSIEENEKDKTSSYRLETSSYAEGTQIQWRVRTAGITKVYGEWSIQRTVDVYAPPTIEFHILNSANEDIETLSSFPFYVSASAGPNTQTPIGYHVAITANIAYETVDNVGLRKMVNAGDSVYSHFFDIKEPLLVELSANNLSVENNISYTITCSASMDSGLRAESSKVFNVLWTNEQYEPNAEIGLNEDGLSTFIRPYCQNEFGVLIDGVYLSVYRRDFDGSFTELAKDLSNNNNIYITDPHPALDFARYRIVAKSVDTGAVSFCDLPGFPIGCKSIVIQWNEDWRNLDSLNENLQETPAWSGSVLKLPYNIDISDTNKKDVSLVKYIGRAHPVTYYGTQLGATSVWNTTIPKSDSETLFTLMRLESWMGDVYVREPSGSGYWASVSVSFNKKHRSVTVPITINVTRVSGGA